MRAGEEAASSASLTATPGTEPAAHAPPSSPGPLPYLRRHPESVRDYLAKRRQVFQAQMRGSLQREEAAKLEGLARSREAALQAAEAALDRDTAAFESHLKRSEAALLEAVGRADQEAAARQEATLVAKRLAAVNSSLRSEVTKAQEQLQEYQRYKEFLDSVTPADWVAGRRAERAAAREAALGAWRAECGEVRARKLAAQAELEAAELAAGLARSQQQLQRAAVGVAEAKAALQEARELQEPPEPGGDAEGGPSGSFDPGALYFREPAQLLCLLREAESQAAAAQAVAHAAAQRRDEARAASGTAGAGLDAEVARLRGEVEGLQAGLRQARSAEHAALPPGGEEAEGEAGSRLPQGLLRQLCGAYQELCAGADAGGSGGEGLAPLRMLGALEARLEEGLAAVDRGGLHAALARTERAREKQRRQAARDRELAAREARRAARALGQAAAPPL